MSKSTSLSLLFLWAGCASLGRTTLPSEAPATVVRLSERICEQIEQNFISEVARCSKRLPGDKGLQGDLAACEALTPGDDLQVFTCFAARNPAGKALVACLQDESAAWEARAKHPECFATCEEPEQNFNACANACAKKSDSADEPVKPILEHCQRVEKSLDGQVSCVRYLAPRYAQAFDACLVSDKCVDIRNEDLDCFKDSAASTIVR